MYETKNYAELWPFADAVILHTSQQQRRRIRHRLNHQKAVTLDVSRACSIANLSDVSAKADKQVHRVGLFIGCEAARALRLNRCDETSHLGLVVALPNAEHRQEQTLMLLKRAAPE